MTTYNWHPSATQRDVCHYTGDSKKPRLTLRRFEESGNVYWRAEYTSALIGSVKTPGRNTSEEALETLFHELSSALGLARSAREEWCQHVDKGGFP